MKLEYRLFQFTRDSMVEHPYATEKPRRNAREAIYKDLLAAVETVLDNFEYEDERYIITPQIIRLDAELRKKLAEYCGQ